MAEGKGILSAARDRLKGTGYVKETPIAAPAVADVRLPTLELPKSPDSRICRPGFTWNKEKRACVKDAKKKRRRLPPLPPPPKIKGKRGIPKEFLEQTAARYGTDPESVQTAMLAEQDWGMFSSAQDAMDWDNNTGAYTVDYNDPNDPYGVSDGFDYNLDMWTSNPGYQNALNGYMTHGTGGGGYFGNNNGYTGIAGFDDFSEFSGNFYSGGYDESDSDDGTGQAGDAESDLDPDSGWSGADSDFYGWNEGGVIHRNTGGYAKGTDTVPAMLSEGEFVIDADSARQFPDEIKKINDWEPENGGYEEVIRDLDELINAIAFGRNPKGV